MPNATSPFSGFEFLSKNHTNITSDVYSVLAITTALNIFTFPFAILLNSLVIVAVKTKRHLRTKSNISLACLATTDFAVGLIVQPLAITSFSLFFIGSSAQTMTSSFVWVSSAVGQTCTAASLLHLLLMSGERYLAIKHPFAYENGLVTEARIIIASSMAWICAAIVYGIRVSIFREISVVIILAVISIVVYCHVVIYKEVRRNTQQIIANQVSLAVKEKLLKNKRAFNTTVVIVLTLFLCYIPIWIWLILFIFLNGENSSDLGQIAFFPIIFLQALNSSINPLIYTARIRHFRVAFFQMVMRKTLAQAEELEKKMFGANRVGVA
nr:adenosine receptor A3-like [Pocillopora verrucosa]